MLFQRLNSIRLLIMLCSALLLAPLLHGQEQYAMLSQLNKEKDLRKKVVLLSEVAYQYLNARNYDSAFAFVQQSVDLCQQQGFKDLLAVAYAQQGNLYYLRGNVQQSLSANLKSIRLMEETGDTDKMPPMLLNIGSLYFDLNDLQGCIRNTRRAVEISRQNKDVFNECFSLLALTSYYNEVRQTDSALIFNQQAILLLPKLDKDTLQRQTLTAFSQANMGEISKLNGQDEIAGSYYRQGLQLCAKGLLSNDYLFIPYLCRQGLSHLYKKAGNPDSAIRNSLAALEIARILTYPKQLQMSYEDLGNLYAETNPREAVKYYRLESEIRDSLFNLKNISDIQNMKLQEEQRQEERERIIAEQELERKHFLEYAATGLAALLLIIGFLLVSRTLIVNEKLIRFLGILILLIVFEFINLLLHPFFGNITHHSPPLMLGCLVLLASLLVPTHHKIEHWLLARVIEKNKRIRLQAARKIIQELDPENKQGDPSHPQN